MRPSVFAVCLLSVAVTAGVAAQQRPAPAADPQRQQQEDQNGDDDQQPPMTPAQEAKLAAVVRYQHAMEASLRASASARDWALSTQVVHAGEREGAAAEDDARGALLRRAAESAPNDRLVQWIWAIAPAETSGCTAARPCRDRGSALARLEPDNGAAWVPAVADAVRFNNAQASDDALARMAAATRYDEVFHDAMGAWLDVFRRFPLPAELLQMPDGKVGDPTLAAQVDALAQRASALAPYDELVHACQRDARQPAATARLANCAKAGRLMIHQSTTIVAGMVGEAVLHASAAATSEDDDKARTAAWQLEQHAQLAPKGDNDAAQMRTQMDLLVGSDSEVAALHAELQRAHVPLTPPIGWQPKRQDGPVGPPAEQRPDSDPEPDHHPQ